MPVKIRWALLAIVLIALQAPSFGQSAWNMIGMSKAEIISTMGTGIQGNGNCLVYLGNDNANSGFSIFFNSKNKVNKIIMTAMFSLKSRAEQEKFGLINLLKDEGFWVYDTDALTDGERKITIDVQFKNRQYVVYTTCR